MPSRSEHPWVEDVARVDELEARGTSRHAAYRRIRGGRWQGPLPGVVVRTTGALTARQQQVAALAYAGRTAALSHTTAGEYWGLASAHDEVHVSVAHGRHLSSQAFLRVHQTVREPAHRILDGLPLTPAPRTVIDMCLDLNSADQIRALMGRAVQKGLVTPTQLSAELELAPKRGSRLPRLALEEITLGARSASEGRLVRLFQASHLPMPELNGLVCTAEGIKYVDALWRSLHKGVEIDGQEFHLDPPAWAADLRRQNAIQLAGIVLLRIPARRLWREPEAVLIEITQFLGLT